MILFYNKSNQLLRREYAQKVLINAITATEMCLIPFYLGMKKSTIRATISSSLIVVSVSCQSEGVILINRLIKFQLIM